MNRKFCQDHTAAARALEAKQATRRAEVKHNVLAAAAMIGFVVVLGLLGAVEFANP